MVAPLIGRVTRSGSADGYPLAYVVSRWYAPSLGTFIGQDSLLGTPADPRCPYFYPLTIRRWGWMISGDSGNRRD